MGSCPPSSSLNSLTIHSKTSWLRKQPLRAAGQCGGDFETLCPVGEEAEVAAAVSAASCERGEGREVGAEGLHGDSLLLQGGLDTGDVAGVGLQEVVEALLELLLWLLLLVLLQVLPTVVVVIDLMSNRHAVTWMQGGQR